MIKVVHLITGLSTGGSEMMLYKLISKMDKSLFYNVVISMTDRGTIGRDIEKLGVKVYTLGMKRGIPSPIAMIKYNKILNIEEPNLIQTWLYHSDLLGTMVNMLKRTNPIIWNIRCSDMDLSKYSRLSKLVVFLCSSLSSLPKAIIVNSDAGKILHQSLGYHPQAWIRIPNGFDLDIFKPNEAARIRIRRELSISDDNILIGIVARYDPMKDIENFIRCTGYLMRDVALKNSLRFILVGRDINYSNISLVKVINENSVSPYTQLLDERGDIPDIMAALDIYCSSSISEGFPNVVGEAMACGVPCVVTDAGDSAQIVSSTGRVVPIKEPQALANGLSQLIKMSADNRKKLGMEARYHIEKYYSLPAIVSQYEELYKEIYNVWNSRNSGYIKA